MFHEIGPLLDPTLSHFHPIHRFIAYFSNTNFCRNFSFTRHTQCYYSWSNRLNNKGIQIILLCNFL